MALRERGVRAGDGVALLMRNHRGFVQALFGAARLGARLILLNTDFAGPQIRDVARDEGARLLICDEEYLPLLEGFDPPLGRIVGWNEGEVEGETVDDLVRDTGAGAPPAADSHASVVILTSGTTGRPKGAPREEPRTLAGPGALFSKVPFRSGECTVIPAPLFHSLGFAHAIGAMMLGSTIVIRRRFDAKLVAQDLEDHRATALIVVPVMLRRVLDAIEARERPPDLSALRIVFVSGSQLGEELARRALGLLGPVVYNLYGSTEVAYATFATPEDLAAAPGCVGRPPRGTRLRIVDDQGRDVPRGQTGRLFVGNPMTFTGYTSGQNKEVLPDGLVSSGDVGHLDEAGRLHIDGRDDDMIVTGGENVFPGDIEEVLHSHDESREAAVIGGPDDEFGHRLAAFVVVNGDGGPGADQVKQYVGSRLARFKVPREVVFVDELPRNPTGKVLKRELSL
jgi:fatty-acyl-CoA synthase